MMTSCERLGVLLLEHKSEERTRKANRAKGKASTKSIWYHRTGFSNWFSIHITCVNGLSGAGSGSLEAFTAFRRDHFSLTKSQL